jgi:hypothetical protein
VNAILPATNLSEGETVTSTELVEVRPAVLIPTDQFQMLCAASCGRMNLRRRATCNNGFTLAFTTDVIPAFSSCAVDMRGTCALCKNGYEIEL